jgi:hypothetical protein
MRRSETALFPQGNIFQRMEKDEEEKLCPSPQKLSSARNALPCNKEIRIWEETDFK